MHSTRTIGVLLLLASSCAWQACQDAPRPELARSQASAEVCSAGPTTFGIDVSRWQGNIDWALVSDEGVKYAYIQISRKIDDIDPKFETNWAGAKQAGILRGAYQRFQPDEDVLGQADIFLEKLGAFEEGDLPPMLDVEDSGGLDASAIAANVRQWLEYVEAATGVRPIIYTGRYFWRDTLDSADFTDYPLWIAHYTQGCPTIPEPWSNWALHQYSSQAVLDGITENTVDVNYFNGTEADLLALAAWRRCGNEVCDPEESNADCPVDCDPDAADPDAGVVEQAPDAGERGEDTDGGGCRVGSASSSGLGLSLLFLAWLALPRRRGRRS